MAKKRAKKMVEKIDGLNPKDLARLRASIRDCWRYSEPHKLVVKRCLLPNGFSKCEGCKKRVPKVFVDHVEVMGHVLGARYIERMFRPSKELQGLCKKCHDAKTATERKASSNFC